MKLNADARTICGSILIGLATLIFGYAITDENRSERRELEIKQSFPPEYWLAEKAREEAKATIRKLELESEEKLEIDRRTRADQDKINQLNFEKNAPDSYWAYKAEEERGKTALKIAKEEARAKENVARESRWAAENVANSAAKTSQAAMRMLNQ